MESLIPQRVEDSNNESLAIFSLMRPDRVHLFFSTNKSGSPPLVIVFSRTQAGACSLCSVPSFAVPRRMGRERIQAGHSGTDVSGLSEELNAMARCVFQGLQALGGGRCL